MPVTPRLEKVHPAVNVAVKLADFKFCAQAAALLPTIGYIAVMEDHTPLDFNDVTSVLIALCSVAFNVPPAVVTLAKKAVASASIAGFTSKLALTVAAALTLAATLSAKVNAALVVAAPLTLADIVAVLNKSAFVLVAVATAAATKVTPMPASALLLAVAVASALIILVIKASALV